MTAEEENLKTLSELQVLEKMEITGKIFDPGENRTHDSWVRSSRALTKVAAIAFCAACEFSY